MAGTSNGIGAAIALREAGPTAYYVNTGGSDSNTGTIGSPFLTPAKAASLVGQNLPPALQNQWNAPYVNAGNRRNFSESSHYGRAP